MSKLLDDLQAALDAGDPRERIVEILKVHEAAEEARKARHVPWLELREMAVSRDGWSCRYCGVEVGVDFHCDHVTPRSMGGENTLDNVVVACRACNVSKKDKTPEEWRAWQARQ